MANYNYPFNMAPATGFKDRLRNFFRSGSALNRLIIINVGLFFLYWILSLVIRVAAFLMASDSYQVFTDGVLRWFACPADFFNAIRQPWCYVTSIFFHVQFWHLLFNMIMLWVAGKLFLNNLSDKQLVITYIIGGIFGNFFYQGAYMLFPVFEDVLSVSRALGASGSIMAVFAAATFYKPNEKLRFLLLGEIKVIWIFIAFVVMDLLSIPKDNAGGHIAHLGGAFYGAVYIFFYAKNLKFPRFFTNNHYKKRKKEKFYTSQQSYSFTDEEYNVKKREKERKIDEILDKISKYGYDALTKDEKDFLFYESKRKQ